MCRHAEVSIPHCMCHGGRRVGREERECVCEWGGGGGGMFKQATNNFAGLCTRQVSSCCRYGEVGM